MDIYLKFPKYKAITVPVYITDYSLLIKKKCMEYIKNEHSELYEQKVKEVGDRVGNYEYYQLYEKEKFIKLEKYGINIEFSDYIDVDHFENDIDKITIILDIDVNKETIKEYLETIKRKRDLDEQFRYEDTKNKEKAKVMVGTINLAFDLEDYRSLFIYDYDHTDIINEMTKETKWFYISKYLYKCFIVKCTFDIFGGKLLRFINKTPNLSKYIWDNVPREQLLNLINTPKRRRTKLMNIKYEDIYAYILIIKAHNYNKSTDQLCRKQDEYYHIYRKFYTDAYISQYEIRYKFLEHYFDSLRKYIE